MAIAHSRPSTFTVVTRPEADRVVVALSGELDLATAEAVRAEVAELRRTGIEHVVLDLARVSFLDARGLSMLLVLRNDARRCGHVLTLIPGPPAVQRIFALTATRGLFDWA